MSTLTPNYGLIVPEETDTVAQVRADYATNLATIDNIQGGGGGGGNSYVYGAFIDTDNVIKATTTFYTSMTYTATEDCYIEFYLVIATNGSSTQIRIDGKEVGKFYRTSIAGDTQGFFVKKGQVVSVSNAHSSYDSSYVVYGIIQGTQGIFTPTIYSDNERMIGVWRDNKPLYQKSYYFSSAISVTTNYSAVGNIDATDIENVVGINGSHADGTYWDDFSADPTLSSHTKLGIRAVQNHSVTYLTIRYTKISDTAGSGDWNTDGIPMVHYSTTEQVIGTWTNGKPLYQITVDVLNPANDSNEHLVDLTSLAIDKCPVLNGYAVRHSGANDITYYANSIETDGWYYFKARFDNFRDSIMYTCLFRNDSIAEMSFTIQYTKTTD